MKIKVLNSPVPSSLPIILAGHTGGDKWFAIDYQDNIIVGNNKNKKELSMSFAEYARWVAENKMFYVYPEQNGVAEIVCGKKDLVQIIEGKNTIFFCLEKDIEIGHHEDGSMMTSDCQSVTIDALPPDGRFVLHPMTGIWNQNRNFP